MRHRLGARALTATNLAAWAFVAVCGALVGWIAVTMVAFGWRPIVIDGGSMAPAIDRGDVAMIDHTVDASRLATGTTVTYRTADGVLVTHRISAIHPDGTYTTRGDANGSDDVGTITPQQIVGAGRLVVPAVGLPVVWARSGALAPMAVAVVLIAAVLLAPGARLRLRTRPEQGARTDDVADLAGSGSREILDDSMRRVRIGASLLLGLQSVTSHLANGTPPARWTATVVAIAVALLGANLLTRFTARRTGRSASTASIAVIAIDISAAVVAVTVLRPMADEVRWALLVLPILEAAVRFRLAGAMVAWTSASVAYVSIELHRLLGGELVSEIVLGRLSTLVQRSGVVLLVAVPGGYLSDHLLRAAAAHRAARRQAARRSDLLEIVVAAGRELNRLDGHELGPLTPAVLSLGFAVADVCAADGRAGWVATHVAHTGDERLPAPVAMVAAFSLAAATNGIVMVDGEDDEDERRELAATGLDAIVLIAMRGRDHLDVLRAGIVADRPVTADQIASLELLAREATVALDNAALVERLRDAHDDLEHQANHDPLTGLANRRRFVERLEDASNASGDDVVAMLFLDLDRFKAVNDTLGHDVGDELLAAVAGRLRRCVRSGDVLARLGGDEFTVLLGSSGEAAPTALAGRICAAIAEPFRLSGHDVEVSASVGIASGCHLAATELMRRADLAMYHAKQSGANAWRVYTADLDASPSSGRPEAMAERLRAALTTDAISLAYQPVADAATGRITGFETVTQWYDEGREVAREAFVPVAEETGMIHELGLWTLRRACEQVASWQVAYAAPLTVSVPTSSRQLEADGFVDAIAQILRTSRLASTTLILRVADPDPALALDVATLDALRSVGAVIQGATAADRHSIFAPMPAVDVSTLLDRNRSTRSRPVG